MSTARDHNVDVLIATRESRAAYTRAARHNAHEQTPRSRVAYYAARLTYAVALKCARASIRKDTALASTVADKIGNPLSTRVDVLAAIATADFRPFDAVDWQTFAGCTSERPLIGEYHTAIIIIDGDTIAVVEDGEETRYRIVPLPVSATVA